MKPLKLMTVFGVALCLMLVSTLPATAETEPNDTPAQANDIGIGWQNAETNASISSPSDVDFFKFSACAGCTFVIETFNVQKKYGVSGSVGTGLWL